MKATITYHITEQAQRAQMAATGQPVARQQVHTIEVPAEEVAYLYVDEEGEVSQTLNYRVSGWAASVCPVIDACNPEEAWQQFVSMRREKDAAEAKLWERPR